VNRQRARNGMTLMEVIVALGLLVVVMAALATVLTDSMRFNASSGKRSQAVQILNYLGRQVVGGNTALLPTQGNQMRWRRGELGNAFPELRRAGRGHANPDNYSAEIDNRGVPASLSGTGVTLNEYVIKVCWESAGKDVCVDATTLAAPPPSGGTPPPLPGIN